MRNLRGTAIAALLVFSVVVAPTARANPAEAYYGPEPELLSEWQLRHTLTGQPVVSLSRDDSIIHSEALTGYASNAVSGDRYGHAVALGGSR